MGSDHGLGGPLGAWMDGERSGEKVEEPEPSGTDFTLPLDYCQERALE